MEIKSLITALLISGILLTCGCTGSDDDDSGTGVSINKDGGIVSVFNGKIELDVPEGSVEDDVDISVKELQDPTSSDGTVPNTIFEFGPDGTSFKKSISLTISYNEEDISEGFSEEDLFLCHFEDGTWIPVRYSEVKPDTNQVTGMISTFSTYGIWAPYLGPDSTTLFTGKYEHVRISDISDNGLVVVGQYKNDDYNDEAYRWTEKGGFKGLGFTNQNRKMSYAIAVDADGDTIVGNSESEGSIEGFIWTPDEDIRAVRMLYKWTRMEMTDISASGEIACGQALGSSWSAFAFEKANAEGMADYLPSSGHAYSRHISRDGTKIFGHGSYIPEGETMSQSDNVTWTKKDGNWEQHGPSDTYFSSMAIINNLGVGDGSFDINDCDNNYTDAVGTAEINEDGDEDGWYWDEENGMRLIRSYLAENGFDETALSFWMEIDPVAISGNGNTIVCNLFRDGGYWNDDTYGSVVIYL